MTIVFAIAFALLAALMNAAWNIQMKGATDPLRTSTEAMTLSSLVLVPPVFACWLLAGRPGLQLHTLAVAAASGLLELAYFVLLSAAYRRGELSTVYPLARGTAPLLAVASGVLLLHERLQLPTEIGIVLLIAGVWVVRRPHAAGSAPVYAVLCGCTIAGYSTLDSIGIHQGAFWLYAWVLWIASALWLQAWALVLRLRQVTAPGGAARTEARFFRLPATRTISISLLMTAAYWLVLAALRIAPLSVVAPLRESSVLVVTFWSVWRLGERADMVQRVCGAASIAAGAILLVT